MIQSDVDKIYQVLDALREELKAGYTDRFQVEDLGWILSILMKEKEGGE